jgi:glucose/arabinose dehydrogenase
MKPFIDGFVAPLAVVNAGDGSGRLFVLEQAGRIRVARDGRLIDAPFLDIGDRVGSGGERGLLGLAFHPNFPNDPRFFVDYTDVDGDTRVASYRVDPANPDRADPAGEKRLLFVDQPYPNHNGGALAFGPDGFLYVSLGDGGSGGDPENRAQSTDTLLGKILRIDVDATSGDLAYAIPPDNPFAAGGGSPEIWLLGLRNPWRMAFDRATGDLWIGDVGQNAWEEIDVQRAGRGGGANFGWRRLEGSHCFLPRRSCEDPAFVGPVTEYGRDVGTTVIGGVVGRGPAAGALDGGYVFADFGSGRVFVIDPTVDGLRPPTQAGNVGSGISAFGEGEDGTIYATDLGDGRLLRVVASRASG